MKSTESVGVARTVARKFSMGGLWIYAEELDILKIGKNSTDL